MDNIREDSYYNDKAPGNTEGNYVINNTYIPEEPEEPEEPRDPLLKKTRKPRRPEYNKDLILPDTVKRQRKPKAALYTAELDKVASGAIQSFYTAFVVFTAARTYYKKEIPLSQPIEAPSSLSTRIHRDQLPPEPKNWNKMLKYPYCAGFMNAVGLEVKQLQGKQTWREVPYKYTEKAGKAPIPLI